ncbi:MAG: penicillin-binding protein 2 [Pseudomonadota bacterium]
MSWELEADAAERWSQSVTEPWMPRARQASLDDNLARRRHRVPARVLRRLAVLALVFVAAVGVIVWQLASLASVTITAGSMATARVVSPSIARPDVLDREGRLLATDLVYPSMFADPTKISDIDETALALAEHLPHRTPSEWREKLERDGSRFVWLQRALAPKLAQRLHDLGLPGINFREELRRVYPAGAAVSHVLGHVDIDNRGRSGIERHIQDEVGTENIEPPGRTTKAPVAISLDLAVQHAVRAELAQAMETYRARGAAGLVLSMGSGEVLAAVSLPDRDPFDADQKADPERMDRLQLGRYELGSVLKIFSVAATLESGLVTPRTRFDVSAPIQVGRTARIADAYPSPLPLTARQVLLRSSNIGTARMARLLGPEAVRNYYDRVGLFDALRTEVHDGLRTIEPQRWDDVHAMTAAFGHGISMTPLRFAASAATLLNRGRPVHPTFLKWHPSRRKPQVRPVVSPAVSEQLRSMLRENVLLEEGTANKAHVAGYDIGGKTGTAEMVVDGAYAKDRVISSFVAILPSAEPRFLLLTMLFEPQGKPVSGAFEKPKRSAGHTAAPTTARIIERIAPILGVYKTVKVSPAG